MMKNFAKRLRVPFSDVSVKNSPIFLSKISEVLKRGDFILGREVKKFEKEFASYIGAKYCVGVASGTDAILLSLRALNISKGSEVIVPAFTFISTATPILMVGARPVFVDVKQNLPVIDENKIIQSVTKKTHAIIVVHLYGYPCNLEKIKLIAKRHRISLIEDCSQAHGTVYKNKKVGSVGDLSVFSFYPTKNIGAFGDGGAVITSNKKINNLLHLLRDHGQIQKYHYKLLGYNSRLDAIQAAILRIKLEQVIGDSKKKELIVKGYIKRLSKLPVDFFDTDNSLSKIFYHLFVIRTKERDMLYRFLKSKGISCGIHYPKALPDEKIFENFVNGKYFPNAREHASSVLSLPLFPNMKEEQLEYVIKMIEKYFFDKDKKNQRQRSKKRNDRY